MLDPVVENGDVPYPLIDNHDQLSEKAVSPRQDVRNSYNYNSLSTNADIPPGIWLRKWCGSLPCLQSCLKFGIDAFALDSPGVNYAQTNNQEFRSPACGSIVCFQDRAEQESPRPFNDMTNKPTAGAVRIGTHRQRLKRTRMHLDSRTELTDDELKVFTCTV